MTDLKKVLKNLIEFIKSIKSSDIVVWDKDQHVLYKYDLKNLKFKKP